MKNLLLIAAILLAGCGFQTVDTGHRGVKTTFGEVDEKMGSIAEGLYFYNPFSSSIIELDTRTQVWEGVANTYTRDIQQADIKFVINYSLERDHAHTVFKEVGREWGSKLLPQAVEGILKQVIGQYDATDLIANRAKATQQVKEAIAVALKPQHIIIEQFQMPNIQYQKNYEASVEQKQVAVQKAIEEKNRTLQIQEQARQRVATAQAEAESMRIRANALVQNPKLVDYEAVQKWDGHLPTTIMGGGTVPFIKMDMNK